MDKEAHEGLFIFFNLFIYDMFPKKLSGVLSKRAVLIQKARSTRSVYYQVNGVVVRLSDHTAKHLGYDLAIYYINRHYSVIGQCAKRGITREFKTKEEVLNFIDTFVSFKHLFIG